MPKKRKNAHGLEMRGDFGESIRIRILDKGKVVHRETLKGTKQKPVSIKLALEKKAELQRLYKTGQIVANQNYTIGELCDDFLEAWGNEKGHTAGYEAHERNIRHYVRPMLEKHKAIDIRQNEAERLKDRALFWRWDQKQKKLIEKKDQTAWRTAEQAVGALSAVLNWAALKKRIGVNPIIGIKKEIFPSIDSPEKERMTHEEVQDILDEIKRSPFWLPAYVAATTGLRRNEILALRWKDIDLDFMQLSVNFQISKKKVGGEFILEDLKTNNSYRTIGMSVKLAAKLREHKEQQFSWMALTLSKAQDDNNFVFCTPELKPWSYYSFSQAFRRAKERLAHKEIMEVQIINGEPIAVTKIKQLRQDITLHDLRHYHASQLIKAKHDPKMVSRRMGHSDVAFTLRVYDNQRAGDDIEAAEWLSNQLEIDSPS